MKSFPFAPAVSGSALLACLLSGCGTPLGNLKPGPEIPVTATPTFTPDSGTYGTVQQVSINDATSGAVIYYTTDGTLPSDLSPVYTGPIKARPTPTGGPFIISAIAQAPGDVQSQIALGQFSINIPLPSYTFQNVAIVGGGYVDGLFFHPKQKGLMYARTNIGGAYRYLVGTDSAWTPITDFVTAVSNGTYLGVESLGLDPSDPTKLYLSLGETDDSQSPAGQFQLSSDQGKTFTEVDAPFKMGANENGSFSGERFGVDPQLGTNIWYGTRDNGLYLSTDGGMTWAQVKSFPVTASTGSSTDPGAGVIFEAFLPASGKTSTGGTKTFYVGVSDPTTGLYVTNDGGATFSPVAGQPAGLYPNSYWLSTADGNLYLTYGLDAGCSANCTSDGPGGVTEGAVWRYTLPTSASPAGEWTNITPPNTSGAMYGYSSVVVDPNHSNTIMVTTLDAMALPTGDDIYRSTDGGATWASIDAKIQRDSSLSPWVNFNQPAPGPGTYLNHIVVDPFNSAHALYGNAQTIWQTTDVTAADGETTTAGTIVPANATQWSIGAAGIEETAVNALAAPPAATAGATPPVELLAELNNLSGFSFSEATIESGKSPAGGADKNPTFTNGTSVDFAGQQPLVVARVGTQGGSLGSTGGTAFGGYSKDGGVTWTPFASVPPGTLLGGGSIAVTADGSTFLWFPSDGGIQLYFSTDDGTTWNASTGSPTQSAGRAQILVYADRTNPAIAYMMNPASGLLYASSDGGQTFNQPQTTGVSGGTLVSMAPSPAAQATPATGDVWLAASNGLYESTDGGNTYTQIDPIQNPTAVGEVTQVYAVGFGAPDTNEQFTYPAIYLSGYIEQTVISPTTMQPVVGTVLGLYRSIDQGVTWSQINTAATQFGGVYQITGDMNRFGRVYLGTTGRGILFGDSMN